MKRDDDTDPATPSSRRLPTAERAPGLSTLPGLATTPGSPVAPTPARTNETNPGVGEASAPASLRAPVTCPPPPPSARNPSAVPLPTPVRGGDATPGPGAVAPLAGTGAPAPAAAGKNDSMDILLEAIGQQDKPFVSKRTSSTAGERSASYVGAPHPVRAATTDPPTDDASVIVASDRDATTQRVPRPDGSVPRQAVDGSAALPPARRQEPTVVLDPGSSSQRRVMRALVAGLLVAGFTVATALFLRAGWPQEGQAIGTSPPPGPPSSSEPALRLGARGAGTLEGSHAVAIEAVPSASAAKSPGVADTAASLPTGSARGFVAQAHASSPPRPAPRASSSKARPNVADGDGTAAPANSAKAPRPPVPGLEDLKTHY